jgi:hypothetical protein
MIMTEYPCPGPVTVDARLGAGSLELYAEPRDTALVEVTPFDGSQASDEAVSDTRVELSGDNLRITAPEMGGWLFRRAPKLRVVVRVPEGSRAYLRTASADATFRGVIATAKVNTASGDIHLEHVSDDLTVNSASGDLHVDRVGGRLTVHAASGDVVARQVDGPVEIKGASTDVDIAELGGDLNANTASGDLRIGAARQGTLRANSASGDVTVGVREGVGVWMDLYTISGRTRNELSMTGDTTPAGHTLTLQIRTLSGDIAIHRSTAPSAA